MLVGKCGRLHLQPQFGKSIFGESCRLGWCNSNPISLLANEYNLHRIVHVESLGALLDLLGLGWRTKNALDLLGALARNFFDVDDRRG